MLMHSKRFRSAICGALLVTASIAGCATTSRSDFVVALPNGYQIVRDKSDEPAIVKRSGGTVIPGPVSRYTVVRDAVLGVVESAPDKKLYFVIDTRTGEVGRDLAENDYTERLKALNIASAPDLSPPVLPK